MRIAQDFLRETIQLVVTKKPPIAVEVEEEVADRKLEESTMYKLCKAGTERIKCEQHGCCI
eukprot:7469591-Ditylum_brightwellii.AAC.1